MASRIQIRRDTNANWSASNPILAQGEIGYDIDSLGTNNSLYKIGDGVSDWNTLPYQSMGGADGVQSVTGDGVGGTSEDVVLSFPTSSEITEDADKNFVTDADLIKLSNTSNTNTGDETNASIKTKRPLKTVNGQDLNGSGDVVTPNTEYTDSEIKTKYESNADTNAFTDAEKTNLGNQSGTNTGDQDISGIATNASNIANNTSAISDKIEADDYAGETVGGTLKVRIDGTEIYFTNDGNNP